MSQNSKLAADSKSVDISLLKSLREETGVSLAACREALFQSGGDLTKAREFLTARGAAVAEKKSTRTLGAGTVASYVHGGKIGALVELCAETDFVAKHEEFVELANDLAMQVAALSPANSEELLAQPSIKKPEVTIADLVTALIQKFGERITVGQIARIAVGD